MKKGAWDALAYGSNLVVFSGPLQHHGAFLSKPLVLCMETACIMRITVDTAFPGELLG